MGRGSAALIYEVSQRPAYGRRYFLAISQYKLVTCKGVRSLLHGKFSMVPSSAPDGVMGLGAGVGIADHSERAAEGCLSVFTPSRTMLAGLTHSLDSSWSQGDWTGSCLRRGDAEPR